MLKWKARLELPVLLKYAGWKRGRTGSGVAEVSLPQLIKNPEQPQNTIHTKTLPISKVSQRRSQSEISCPSVKGSQWRILKGGSGHRESCGQTCGPDKVLDLGAIYCCVTPLSL